MGRKARASVDLDGIRAAIDERLAELRDEQARLMAARDALTSGERTPAAVADPEHRRPHGQPLAGSRASDPVGDRPVMSARDDDGGPADAREERASTVTPQARTRSAEPQPPLTIELVPLTCWQTNVRSAVPRKAWDQLRRRVYADAGNRCEVCGERGTRPALHCHEVWEYDDERHVQRLARMVALCPSCHAVKHIGRSAGFGYGEDALRQLARVNDWTLEEARAYAVAAFEQWHERSTHEWTLDLDGLRAYGIDPATVYTPSATDRAAPIRQRMSRTSPGSRTRRSKTASPHFDVETGAQFWLCDGCGQRGDAVLKDVHVSDAHPAIREFLQRTPGRFADVVTEVLDPPGWKRTGGRLICNSCASADRAS
jgi:5-methylcytosine-specific restriction endonuclease McrA